MDIRKDEESIMQEITGYKSIALDIAQRIVSGEFKVNSMNNWQLLIKVQLPLALPFLMAGFRVAAVIAIGVATLAPLIGGDGLGREIYAGLNMRNSLKIYAGAIPAALLAIVTDIVLGRLQEKWKAKHKKPTMKQDAA